MIYLDQNILSIIFSVKSGSNLPKGHEDFSKEMFERLRRLVLLQQIKLPLSDIHSRETITFHSGNELRRAIEHFGGGVSFWDTDKIALMQMIQFAQAYIEKRTPEVNCQVDEALQGKRNRWLDDMHISVNTDYSQFAQDIRMVRDKTHEEMQTLFNTWAANKPSFEDVLKHELASLCTTRLQVIHDLTVGYEAALNDPDPLKILSLTGHPVIREYDELAHLFIDSGVAPDDAPIAVRNFWQWDQNAFLPSHQIACYLFAALGRRAASGQNVKRMTRGFVNDVTAISTYAPYVDAMFVDKECANLLSENPLEKDLNYRAQIFSMNNTAAFIDYLDSLERQTPDDVMMFATQIYGLEGRG